MTDFYAQDGDVDDFALPGDEAALTQLGLQQEADAQPRDPAGRFASKEVPAEEAPAEEAVAEEPEAEAVEEPAPETPEPELILGKFKTPEELAAAYRELESFKGRQSNEINELRQALEERFSSLEQQAARPAAPSNWDDLILDNPAAATKLAYQHGDQFALQQAAKAWEELSPGAPELWAETVRMRAEMDERLAKYDQALAPVQQHAHSQKLASDMQVLVGKYPDIGEFMQGDEFAQLAEQIPLAKKALTEGTTDEIVSAVETVYLIHRGRASDNLKDAVRDVAHAAAQEAEQLREDSFVASAAATTTAEKPSLAEKYAAGWEVEDNLFANGWNVGR